MKLQSQNSARFSQSLTNSCDYLETEEPTEELLLRCKNTIEQLTNELEQERLARFKCQKLVQKLQKEPQYQQMGKVSYNNSLDLSKQWRYLDDNQQSPDLIIAKLKKEKKKAEYYQNLLNLTKSKEKSLRSTLQNLNNQGLNQDYERKYENECTNLRIEYEKKLEEFTQSYKYNIQTLQNQITMLQERINQDEIIIKQQQEEIHRLEEDQEPQKEQQDILAQLQSYIQQLQKERQQRIECEDFVRQQQKEIEQFKQKLIQDTTFFQNETKRKDNQLLQTKLIWEDRFQQLGTLIYQELNKIQQSPANVKSAINAVLNLLEQYNVSNSFYLK